MPARQGSLEQHPPPTHMESERGTRSIEQVLKAGHSVCCAPPCLSKGLGPRCQGQYSTVAEIYFHLGGSGCEPVLAQYW